MDVDPLDDFSGHVLTAETRARWDCLGSVFNLGGQSATMLVDNQSVVGEAADCAVVQEVFAVIEWGPVSKAFDELVLVS